jgi:hypothetical protein
MSGQFDPPTKKLVVRIVRDEPLADPPQNRRWRSGLLLDMAPAGMSRSSCWLCNDGRHSLPGEHGRTPKNESRQSSATMASRPLIRWSIQEIPRIAIKMARRQMQPAYIIAWSAWRRAHQAAARQTHLKAKMQR